ncbi:acyl CoA:acetate/3-ketoacid CoA transferase, beta subunit [Neobacillus bataviensis LMG 21833]|uniref:Acyl CoA:acetate/3-ketoacid CoA transferase, beta subunit n=1 Tax=Neobacillus bataviensis LMG 21833 TaxID=1117379 RepID=K6DDP5_9BACI|nr:3-oxoacid CoA-transferase subunit B [Neobacillus bataviensis]EKN70642.1 acyl CoA:acetate/3-ketoacid CoA transferase, beta subunit [Neobacillus bataviensis LMG 21833]
MSNESIKHDIAWRCARELTSGVVNLGIGIPSLVSNYLPQGMVTLHSENGVLGVGPLATEDNIDPELVNAGRLPITLLPHASIFDISMSLGMMRGGHLDATVIGALQVAENGDLASWAIAGKDVLGVGGAMDLVVGARRVIVAMTHLTDKGEAKILPNCTQPLTAKKRVDTIVTQYAVFKIREGTLWLVEMVEGISFDQLKAMTPASYEIAPDFKIMNRMRGKHVV